MRVIIAWPFHMSKLKTDCMNAQGIGRFSNSNVQLTLLNKMKRFMIAKNKF